MDDLLAAARQQVSSFLLPTLASGLRETTNSSAIERRKSQQTIALSKGSLRIAEDVSPQIEKAIVIACTRLRIPRHVVDVFVFPGSELTAFCIPQDIPLTVGLSSTLVRILSVEELTFVLGHELGHGLFPQIVAYSAESACLEDAILARAVEVTVDRVGLLAAGDQDAAFRAILKTLSGLTEEMLRFDFSHFLSEARQLDELRVFQSDLLSSHPPLAQRFRALLSFALSDAYLVASGKDASPGMPINRVNEIVVSTLNLTIDQHARAIIQERMTDLAIWVACFLATSHRQVSISGLSAACGVALDKDSIQRATSLISSFSDEQRGAVMQEKIAEAVLSGMQIAPRATRQIVNSLQHAYPELRFVDLDILSAVKRATFA